MYLLVMNGSAEKTTGSKHQFFGEAEGGREQVCALCVPLLWKRTDCMKIPDGAHVLLLGSNSLSHRWKKRNKLFHGTLKCVL
jgi:hypothetical protein